MTRPLRIEFEGAFYHLTSRGNARQAIFLEQSDRRHLLELLAQCVDRYHWLCHGYCLMDNHYHLLVETPIPNLSKGMRHLNGAYTQLFNKKWTSPRAVDIKNGNIGTIGDVYESKIYR